MTIGPGELLILALVMLPVLGALAGFGTLVYFLTRKPARRPCGVCGLPNAVARQHCPRCGALVA
jgi:hypothetical protein